MKKSIILVLVMVVVMVVMSACGSDSTGESIPVEAAPIYSAMSLSLETEELVIDNYAAGYVYSYGGHSMFRAESAEGYLLFLKYAKENEIEIIDISMSIVTSSMGRRYIYHITYTTTN